MLGQNRQRLGQKQRTWTEEKNKQLLAKIDKSNDGKVDEEEFVGHFTESLSGESDSVFLRTCSEFIECVPKGRRHMIAGTSTVPVKTAAAPCSPGQQQLAQEAGKRHSSSRSPCSPGQRQLTQEAGKRHASPLSSRSPSQHPSPKRENSSHTSPLKRLAEQEEARMQRAEAEWRQRSAQKKAASRSADTMQMRAFEEAQRKQEQEAAARRKERAREMNSWGVDADGSLSRVAREYQSPSPPSRAQTAGAIGRQYRAYAPSPLD